MAFDPDFETIAGTSLRLVRGRPTDDTAAAYATLFTGNTAPQFELTSIGGVEGREYSESTISTVASGRDRVKPGTYRYPTSEFGVVWLSDSDAQVDAESAMIDRAICSFEMVRQSGATLYFTGYVANLSEGGGGPNDALTGTLRIMRDSEVRRAAVTP